MNALASLIRYEIWFLVISLLVIVSWQLLTGRINTRGLLDEKTGNRNFSPAQLQLLVFTVGGAFYYLLLVLDNPNPGTFPEVPDKLLLLLGGSHVFYQTSDLSSLLRQKFGSLLSGTQTGSGDQPQK